MSRDLADCRPIFRVPAQAWLDDCHSVGLVILLTSTLRTQAEQQALYDEGRTTPGPHVDAAHPLGRTVTNAKPGQSAHNWGLALDFVPIVNGKPDWDGGHPVWAQVIAMAEARGLESLAKSAFPEEAHIQLPNWRAHIGDTA